MKLNFSAAALGKPVAARGIVLTATAICAGLGAIASMRGGVSLIEQPVVLASAAAAAAAPPMGSVLAAAPSLIAPVAAAIPVAAIIPAQNTAMVRSSSTAVNSSLRAVAPLPSRAPELAEASGANDTLRVPEASDWKVVHVRRHQTLSDIFHEMDLPHEDAASIVHAGRDAHRLASLHSGETLRILRGSDHVAELTYAYDDTHTLDVRRAGAHFESSVTTSAIEHRPRTKVVVIDDSLYVDGHHAGLTDRQIHDFANLFNYDVDFAQDLQDGDRCTLVIDELYTKDGRHVGGGDILAAQFDSGGDRYRAVRFVGADGTAAYYTPDGQSLRKWFIRTPVEFTRISSGFSLHRWHPILHRMRAHKGVDYAAPKGTPVHASGDGRVEFAGRKGGYGNVVILQHGEHYETVYGHLSRFARGLRAGAPVHQGEVIAFVGMTGLATAPHLHYEFRVDGIPRNPVTVKLPRANPLSSRELAQFHTESKVLVARLDSPAQYADAESTRAIARR